MQKTQDAQVQIEVIHNSEVKSQANSGMSAPKPGADLVMRNMPNRQSIWDNFDITKMSNADFKLQYVSPVKYGKNSVVERELEVIESEIEYWRNAIVCFVLEAHPHLLLSMAIFRECGVNLV